MSKRSKIQPHYLMRLYGWFKARLELIANLMAKIDCLFHPSKSNNTDKLIIGHNNNKYIVHKDWGKQDPQKYPVKNCHEMVQDEEGNLILLTDHVKNNILFFNRNGEVIKSWTLQLKHAHGLTIGKENNEQFLLICDPFSSRVLKTTLDGEVLLELPTPYEIGIYSAMKPYFPTETTIASNGDIYVADGYGSSHIIQFNAEGNYIRHFGGKQTGNAGLSSPHGITIDRRNREHEILITSSRMESCFKKFSLEGKYLGKIETPGTFPCRPVIKKDNLYTGVCWSSHFPKPNSGFVMIINKEDKVISNPGGIEPKYVSGKLQKLKQDQKVFKHCHDVCIDDEDNIYVCEWNANHHYPIKLELIREIA